MRPVLKNSMLSSLWSVAFRQPRLALPARHINRSSAPTGLILTRHRPGSSRHRIIKLFPICLHLCRTGKHSPVKSIALRCQQLPVESWHTQIPKITPAGGAHTAARRLCLMWFSSVKDEPSSKRSTSPLSFNFALGHPGVWCQLQNEYCVQL